MAYNVSSAFREQCYSGSSLYKCRLIIGEETIPTSQIASITISSPIVDSENEIFYIGTFISQKLTIQFKNLDGINTKSGTGVELYISQYVNNNWEEVPIGKYIIDESPEDYYKSSKIECLDYAIKFATNLDYSPAFVDNKITIDNLLQWICDYYGVTLGSYPSTNGDIEIGTYDSTISGKRWISYIAELKGCNAKMDRLGQLTLVPLKSSPVVTIDAKKSKSWELGEKFEVSKVTYFDATRNYTFGDDTENTLILRQDNPFVVNEQVVRNIYENLRLASSMVEENTNFTLENTVEGEPIGSLSLKGDTQQNTTILPSKYQQVEYIQSSGTQYIETNVNLSNNSFKISTKMSVTEFEQQEQAIMSIWLSNYSYWNCFITTSKKISLYLGGHNIIDKVLELNKQYNLEVERINNSNWKVSLDNDTVNANYSPSSTNETTLKLFTRGDVPTTSNSNTHIKMYGCKIIKNNIVMRDYVPCYRKSDNVIGLYDLVNNVFYTNAGTGTFTKGNNVTLPTPDYPQEVKTVTGGQEINVTGKNMYDINNFSYAQQYQVTSSISNGIITTTPTSGTSSPWFITIKPEITVEPNQQYTLSFNVNGSLAKLRIYSVSPQGYYEFSGSISNNRYVGTITMPNNVTNIRLMFYYNQGTTTTISNIMFEKGNITNPTYEPYQSFTQEINLGKNLFDKSSTPIYYSQSMQYTETDTGCKLKTSSSGSGFVLIDLGDIKNYENKALTFSMSNTANALYKYIAFIGCDDVGENRITIGNALGSSSNTLTTTIGSNYTQTRLTIRLYIDGGTANTDYELNNIMVEKGTQATSFSPYKTPIELCKIGDYQDEILKSTGKNLINTLAYNKTANSSGAIITPSSPTYYLSIDDYIDLTPNTTYTITFSQDDGGKLFVATKDINGNFIERHDYRSNRTFTTNSDVYKGFIYIYKSGGTYTSGGNVMLNYGETALPYEPYGTGWYVKKNIGKVVLDGSESWNQWSTNTFYIAKISEVRNALSNYYAYSSTATGAGQLNNGEFFIHDSLNNNAVIFKNTSISSVADFKTWLSTHNTEVYYALATPNYTVITDTELIEQLEHFEHNAKFYGGVTNINSTSPITFKLFTSDPFICYSLKTENYGDISLDSWDNITYTLEEETYNTLNNNTVTYEMTIMSKTETKIPTKQQEVTTNVVGGNVEQRVRRIGSEVNNLSGQVTILGEEVDETSESLAEFTLTTDASIQSLTQTTSNIASEEQTHYQEMLSKMDDKASISDIETITNQVNVLQTDTYTKTEVNKIIDGTDENGLRVQVLQSTSAILNEDGMTYNKTGANTSSNINQAGVTVTNKKNNSELLFAGYDEQKLEALVRVANLYLTRFLGLDVWRVEIINDSTNGKGLGFFYIG